MSVRSIANRAFMEVALRGILAVERVQTGASFYPAGEDFHKDPYKSYRRLREKDPIHRSRLIQGWVLTRHTDISAILRDTRFSVDERKLPNYATRRARRIASGGIDPEAPDIATMLTSDPPDHTRLRSLVNRAFTPRMVERLRSRVESLVQQQLDAVADHGGMDVMEAVAQPLPVLIIAEMLGVPSEDHLRFKHWSDETVLALGVVSEEDGRRALKARQELRAYLEGIAELRRQEPREDLLSALLDAEAEGDRLSTDELIAMCGLLLVAGHETTTNLIGNGMLALLRNQDQLDLLRRDPSLWEQAVEEMLRYDSPVQATARFVPEDMEVGGQTFRKHQQAILILGAANRDPDVFPEPDRLDVTRANANHLSFGHGIHYCLGAPLARLEAPVAFRAILERYPEIRLDDRSREPKWKQNFVLRGLQELWVKW